MSPVLPTSEQAAEYVWFGKQCLKDARRTGRAGVRAITDGAITVICKFDKDKAFIIIQSGDFLTHPRSGSLVSLPYYDSEMNLYHLIGINGGGWAPMKNGWRELDTRWIYPLVDNDMGTFIVSAGTLPDINHAVKSEEDYGNCYWVGIGAQPPVLSWRGPPSLQFPIDPGFFIPGLSQNINDTNTVFGTNIYQGGAVLCPCPGGEINVVLGAAFSGTKLVLISLGNRQLGVQISTDSGKKWVTIYTTSGARTATTPAFIAPDGKSFVYDRKIYTLSNDLSTVANIEQIGTATGGGRNITNGGGYNSTYHYHGVKSKHFAMDPYGKPVSSTFNYTAAFGSSGYNGETTTTIDVPIYTGNPATAVTIRYNPDIVTGTCEPNGGYNAGFSASANGEYCTVEWTGVTCFKGLNAVKKVENCDTGGYTVVCTLQPQGVSGHLDVPTIDPDNIYINGPANAGVGSQYNVVGLMRGTITWSITNGTISQGGTVLSTGCGSGTITVTDQCGHTATKTVRFPDGTWFAVYKKVRYYDTGAFLTVDMNCNGEDGTPYFETTQLGTEGVATCGVPYSRCIGDTSHRALIQIFYAWLCSNSILVDTAITQWTCNDFQMSDTNWTYALP